VPELLERYFDYEAFGRDMFLGDYTEYEGHIFLDM
jgi:antirestriction protein